MSEPNVEKREILDWLDEQEADEEKEAIAKEGRIIDGAISRADDEEYGKGGRR